MSTLTVKTLQGMSPTNLVSIASGHSFYAPGCIIQVKQAYKDDPFAYNSTSYGAVTGLSVAITPKFATSKILIMACVNSNSLNRGGTIEVRRDGNRFMMPTNSGSREIGRAHV